MTISTDLGDLAALFSVILSIIALIISIVFSSSTKKRSGVELSINMAKDYQRMLEEASTIRKIIIRHQDIYELITQVELDSSFDFTQSEIRNKIKKEENFELLRNFFFTGSVLNQNVLKEFFETEMLLTYHNSLNLNKVTPDTYIQYFQQKVSRVLNTAEYISMSFAHKIAIDGVVYQSLHQSFFTIVGLLYFYISNYNINPTDHYFTNLVTLYRRWKREDELRATDLRRTIRVQSIDTKKTECCIDPKM